MLKNLMRFISNRMDIDVIERAEIGERAPQQRCVAICLFASLKCLNFSCSLPDLTATVTVTRELMR